MAVFIDTNVLLYSVSADPREASKRGIAVEILDRRDCALSVQVLQEFYVQATSQKAAFALPHGLAAGFIEAWLRFHVEPLTVRLLGRALDIKHGSKLSYWDAAVVAAAEAAGCERLLSEDMSHGQKIGGVRIENPFRHPSGGSLYSI